MRNSRFLLFGIIIILIIIISITIYKYFSKKSQDVKTTLLNSNLTTVFRDDDDDPVLPTNRPDYDGYSYPFRTLFSNQLPIHYTDSFGITHTPTGNEQTIAIVSDVLSVWSADNVIRAMAQTGITNKSPMDIVSQVISIDATLIEHPFEYMDKYENLTVPLSNGIQSQVEYEDVIDDSRLLEVALQCLFTALPDVKIVIFYYGIDPSMCPPDEDDAIELYEDVIKHLYDVMDVHPIFNIFVNRLVIENHSDPFIQYVRQKIINMRKRNVQVITTSGEYDYYPGDSHEYETFPPAFSNIIKVGGLARLFNSLPIVYTKSNGGYFVLENVDYEGSTIPYSQVGYVTPQLPTLPDPDPDRQYVGVPDVSGFCTNFAATFGFHVTQMTQISDITIAAYAYAVIIAMVNEISNERAWNYQRLFYRYHFFLFDYVNRGTNNIHDAQNYRIWNPCSGLGQLNGNNLAALLSNKYILTGYPTQLACVNITELMCYVNFYPASPLRDPLNDPGYDGGDYVQSQPVFGPQSIWSELFIYVIKLDPVTNQMMIPLEYSNEIVKNGDIIVIVSSQSYSTAWALAYVDGKLQITTHNIRQGVPIPPEFLWYIDCIDSRQPYIRITSAVRLSPFLSERRSYLTSRYLMNRSPSLIGVPDLPNLNDISIMFSFVPHVYHLIKPDYNDTKRSSENGIQKSYFINFTNDDSFITSGYRISDFAHARDRAANYENLPYVQFVRSFDPVPQWLLIPCHSLDSETANVGLTFGRYMFFNTRCQAYLYIHRSDDGRHLGQLININNNTAPVSRDIYNWAIFHIRSSEPESSQKIFRVRGLSLPPYNTVNDFLTKVNITFEAPYFSSQSIYGYRLYLSAMSHTAIDDGINQDVLQFLLTPSSPVKLNIFLIQTDFICTSDSQYVLMKPTFVTDNNRRFSNCVISATNANDYVAMIPFNSLDSKQKWECIARPTVHRISNTFYPFMTYPILHFNIADYNDNPDSFTFTNFEYKDMFLIHCEGGWKPRLGYRCDDGIKWSLRANYYNESPNTLKLSGNYFYLNTPYYVNCTRGTLTCAINVPHLPALLTEINAENINTDYFGRVIATLILFSRKKKEESSSFATRKLLTDPDYDNDIYPIRRLYADAFLFNRLPIIPTGIGQKIAIVADVLSVWYVEDILSALRYNGIYNKSADDILSQIDYVNATVIQDQPFRYLNHENLHVPLSNGRTSQIPFSDVDHGSRELSTILQTIFCLVPDVRIIIYYIGAATECPPDDHDITPDPSEVALRSVIQYLMAALSQTRNSFDILCITIPFSLEDQSENFYRLIDDLITNRSITIVTTVGTAADTNTTYPCGFPKIINAGGFAWTSVREPVAFINSHGGYFISSPYAYQNSVIPYYQIGNVPNDQFSSVDHHYVGCPDISGNIRNLAIFINNEPNPVSHETMSISPAAYSSLLAMINQGSNNRKWNYPQILYRYSDFLFDKITTGQNDRYNASDYRSWNPCTGLGMLKGYNLAFLMSSKYVLTGMAVQFSSITISEKMSYMNFFPCSPLRDPLNFQPQHDYYNSLPSFGPQSIWSSFLIFKINMNTGILDTGTGSVVRHGDTVVILFKTRYFDEHQQSDLYYILECFDRSTVRTHTFFGNQLREPIDPRYRWIIVRDSTTEPLPILLFDKCKILPFNYQAENVRLSSRYSRLDNSLFATSPSLSQTPDDDQSDIFMICPHSYPYLEFTDGGYTPERSYFVNLTTFQRFWSCGIDATDISSVIHSRNATNTPSGLPYVQLVHEFDPIPQWLLIPLYVEKQKTVKLRFGDYAIFNTRLRSFVYFDYSTEFITNGRLKMINVNHDTAPLQNDLFSYCRFRFSCLDMYLDSPHLFRDRCPMNELDGRIKINNFLCPLQIFFDSPYYKDKTGQLQSRAYTLHVLSEDTDYVRLGFDCPDPSTPTSFCFHVDPSHLISQYSDITMFIPDTHINQNNIRRFINNAVSSDVSNSYVRMVPYDDVSWRRNTLWKTVVATNNTIADFSMPFEFSFPVLDFNNITKMTFENVVYPSQYLIHSDGGWKPRLGFARNEHDNGLDWFIFPNYLNRRPSDTTNVLGLSGNYFYHRTLYYIDSSDGVLTCSINVPHLPALLTEINRENVDTTYYSSMFLII